MPLHPGDKVGPYEIVAPIGAGGMGEVYKAKDTRLNRTVAIKVLPDHIAQREDLRARFEREARAVASLNHPNICTLHDIGNQSGTGYMVMEFMEGETLAERIEKSPLPLDQTLKHAAQIADALDRAHRAGVTHRDIKLQNIILTRDGVKLLDFGLAKSVAQPGPTDATLTKVLTTEGTVMGTPQYMAPELFEGKEADVRADIWAFGAVLYEMATGQKAFQGKSYASLVGAILSADPAPMALQPFTPFWLERFVRRCLAKDPEDRWQSIRVVVLELQQPPPAAPEISAPKTNRWPWVIAGVSIAVALLAVAFRPSSATAPSLPSLLELSPPAGTEFASITDRGGSAIPPDGRTLAFIAITSNGETLLHLRALDSRAVRALPGTQDAARPFWSPDSKSLGFYANRKLKRVDLAGGLPVLLSEVAFARGGTWNEDGVILFGDQRSPLRRIPASGGTPTPVTRLDGPIRDESHYYPQFLPGGKRFLYLATRFDEATNARTAVLYLGSLDSQVGTRLVDSVASAVYHAGSRHLLYMREPGIVLAQKLELDPPRLVGEPMKVAEGVGYTSSTLYAEFSVSNSGTLLFGQRNGAGQLLQFGWRDRVGKLLEALGTPMPARFWFDLSPDERRLAYYADSVGGSSDVWIREIASGLTTRFTFDHGRNTQWSSDGKSIYYFARKGFSRKSVDGVNEPELLFDPGVQQQQSLQSVSPDSTVLLYGNGDILQLPLAGSRKPTPFLETRATEEDATFSPDGRWVAYTSDESGRREVYVQSFPTPQGKLPVSAEGGMRPRWRADGRELYWVRPDRMLMAASVTWQPSGPRFGAPESLFVVSNAGGIPTYRPARDGRRFLVLDPPKDAPTDLPKIVLQNWTAGLRK